MIDEGFGDNNLEFGGGEECVVESDSLSPSNKRVKEMPIDRLSDLPELLLIHILSFLGVKEAGKTSVLSKRWSGLWAELPRLEFWGDEKTLDFVAWVNRTLDIRKGDYLEKFLVKFMNYNKCFASDVDAWVEYSVKNEAKELILMIYSRDCYRPPQMLYSCSSLMKLHLSGCIISSESRINWKSLTRLSLDTVELNQALIDDILSSCPVLNSLELEACLGFNRLEVNSRRLNRLKVQASLEKPYLEISAPYVCDLDITVFPQRREWQLKNISSVVEASIDFYDFDGGLSEEVMSDAKEFLEKFKHVKKLSIASQCFEVVSIMARNGWQLPQFKLRNLTLCSDNEHGISGVIAMLDSSPNIETLLLKGYETDGNIFNFDPAAKRDLGGDLVHLKKIKVDNFGDSKGYSLLALAWILLRRAPALEEMMIVIDFEDGGDFINIAQTLLSYPRSSAKAEVYLITEN